MSALSSYQHKSLPVQTLSCFHNWKWSTSTRTRIFLSCKLLPIRTNSTCLRSWIKMFWIKNNESYKTIKLRQDLEMGNTEKLQSDHRSHRKIKLSIFRKDLLNICWRALLLDNRRRICNRRRLCYARKFVFTIKIDESVMVMISFHKTK